MNDTWWVKPEELDDEQREAIDLPLKGNYLITGPPGSGKTNLVVLRANYLIRAGLPNVLMLVFTRTLEEFIAHCPTPYRIPRDRLKTIQRWEMEMINQLGGSPSNASDFQEKRRENCKILKQLIEHERLGKIYDSILLDETQDYWTDEIELATSITNNIFAVGDRRQKIYDHSDSIAVLQQHCREHHLTHHYRNGRLICELADAVGRSWTDYVPLAGTSQYNEVLMPSKVQLHRCGDIEVQAKQILEAVRLQIKAYPEELIGVMCPRHNELSILHDAFAGTELDGVVVYQSAEEGYLPFDENTRICVCTLHSAKGLEFRASHIAGMEWVKRFRQLQRHMTYTGITRAKTILDVYHTDTLPPHIESAFSAIDPKEPPSFDDLFKE